MVRLKAQSDDSGWNVEGFQFLYGAIKSVITIPTDNSQIFQFLYGAIKRKSSLFHYLHSLYFNSSMVRLKEAETFKEHSRYEFQFLYGAIKSRNATDSSTALALFQFLYGAIKRVQQREKR